MKIHCAYDKLVKIKDLKTHPKNPNKHSEEQIKRLASIVSYQGIRRPIRVSKLSGCITAGHGLRAALKRLGEHDVPVNFQDYESEEQELADIVADNAIASWAELDLSAINLEVPNLGPDFDIDLLGLKDFEIEPADKYGDKDADAVPESRKTEIVLGDMFRLGAHTLLCGDSTKSECVERLMNGEKADMVYTDPPYGMNLDADYSGMVNKEGVAGSKHRQIVGDDMGFDPSHIFKFFDCDEIVLFGADYFAEKIPDRNAGSWLVWDKRVEEKYDAVIGSGFELIWSKKRRKRQLIRHDYSSWGGRMADNLDGAKPHPTMKPVGLIEKCFALIEGNLVVDLYLGSGSTLIACEKTNRKCFGMEIDPQYCQVIIDRWEKFTGQKASKLN